MPLTIEVVAKGETENGKALEPGMQVEYLGHLPGGIVKIKLDDNEDVAHPLCFKELRE